jgi:hypothetical protein
MSNPFRYFNSSPEVIRRPAISHEKLCIPKSQLEPQGDVSERPCGRPHAFVT